MSFVAKRKCSISILLLASVWMLTITPVAAAEDDTFPQSNDVRSPKATTEHLQR